MLINYIKQEKFTDYQLKLIFEVLEKCLRARADILRKDKKEAKNALEHYLEGLMFNIKLKLCLEY